MPNDLFQRTVEHLHKTNSHVGVTLTTGEELMGKISDWSNDCFYLEITGDPTEVIFWRHVVKITSSRAHSLSQ